MLIYSGTGAVYSFDPVGSYEREACRAAGAAQSLVQPFLDNQVSFPRHHSSFSLVAMPPRLFFRDAPILLPPRCHYQLLTSFDFLTDLLQKPNACARNLIPTTPSIEHCVVPCDRLLHRCHRTAH